MLQFYLSNVLSQDLKMHLEKQSETDYQALQWYAHRVTIARRKCVIAMERQSRYAMVFCGLKKRDFENFPQIFQERLWREVISITQLEDEEQAIISDLVLDISAEQYFQAGSDRSVMAHINQVADELHFIAYNNEPLPVSSTDAFAFGMKTNKLLRKRKNDQDYFHPIDVFKHLWLGMFNIMNKSPARPGVTLH